MKENTKISLQLLLLNDLFQHEVIDDEIYNTAITLMSKDISPNTSTNRATA